MISFLISIEVLIETTRKTTSSGFGVFRKLEIQTPNLACENRGLAGGSGGVPPASRGDEPNPLEGDVSGENRGERPLQTPV